MHPIAIAVLLATSPVDVADAHTGAAIKLPAGPLCVTLPAVEFDAKACAPKTAKQLDTERQQLVAMNTAKTVTLALARLPAGMGVTVVATKVALRSGKLPPGFLQHLVDDMARGAADDDGRLPTVARHGDATYEVESFNGISTARVEMVMTYGPQSLTTVSWVVLAPNGNFTVGIAGTGPAAELRKQGTAIMATLAMPEKQRVDLTGRVPIP
jgi:hypothetical protein